MASQIGLDKIPELSAILTNSYALDAFRPSAKISQSHQPWIVEDTYKDPQRQDVPGLEWVQSYASAGMLMDDQLVGLLILMSDQPHYFRVEIGGVLQAFTNNQFPLTKTLFTYPRMKQPFTWPPNVIMQLSTQPRWAKNMKGLNKVLFPEVVRLMTQCFAIKKAS